MIARAMTKLRSLPTLRLPHRTVRVRLTLVYGGLFLVSGAALLAVTYLLFERATTNGNQAVQTPDSHPAGHTIPSLPAKELAPRVVSLGPKALGEQIKRSSDLHQLLINSAIALAIVTVVALVLGWFVAGRILRPLRTMTATARRISATNLHERLDLHGPNDELKELGDTFDELLGRLQRSWDSQRQFVANVSHELRSPLTRLRLQADIAATDPEATVESLQSGYQAVIAAAEQQEQLIAALLSLAKGQRGLDHPATVDLASVTVDILQAQREQTDERGLQITTDISPATVRGDPRLIEQLVENLIDNATRHNIPGGKVHITTASETGKSVLLAVSNDGPIIAPTDLERLFRPFERLQAGRRHYDTGHGLGLSIVEAIATAHGAAITARSRNQGGLSIEITFPSADPTSPTGRPASAPTGTTHSPSTANINDPSAVGSAPSEGGRPLGGQPQAHVSGRGQEIPAL